MAALALAVARPVAGPVPVAGRDPYAVQRAALRAHGIVETPFHRQMFDAQARVDVLQREIFALQEEYTKISHSHRGFQARIVDRIRSTGCDPTRLTHLQILGLLSPEERDQQAAFNQRGNTCMTAIRQKAQEVDVGRATLAKLNADLKAHNEGLKEAQAKRHHIDELRQKFIGNVNQIDRIIQGLIKQKYQKELQGSYILDLVNLRERASFERDNYKILFDGVRIQFCVRKGIADPQHLINFPNARMRDEMTAAERTTLQYAEATLASYHKTKKEIQAQEALFKTEDDGIHSLQEMRVESEGHIKRLEGEIRRMDGLPLLGKHDDDRIGFVA